jgi:hypothetical protein
MSDDDVRAGEELARSWLQGKSGLSDDLALLVSGLSQPLDTTARAFISMIGNAAKAAPRGKARPTPAGAPAARPPDLAKAQPSPEAPPAPLIDLNEMLRRRREREHARRLEELGRRNQEAWQQLEMVHRMGAGGDWR